MLRYSVFFIFVALLVSCDIDLPKVVEPPSYYNLTDPNHKDILLLQDKVLLQLEDLKRPKGVYSHYNDITEYDAYFKKYSKKYFSVGFDYLWFKAQAIVESELKADAVSSAGAVGIMQIMPGTWSYIEGKNSELKGSINDPEQNIAAGIWYMSYLWDRVEEKPTWMDRWDFTAASYNAGITNVLKAQRYVSALGLNINRWANVQLTLPDVTGRHADHTIEYLLKIKQCRRDLQ